MNKSIIKALLCAGVLFATSCLSNYDEYNTNPGEVTDDQMEADDTKAMAALQGMQSNILPSDEHLYQFVEALVGGPYGGYFADTKPWNESFPMYNPTEDWLEKPMECIVNIYKNQKLLRTATKDPVLVSIGDVVRVAAMVRLSDIYGPIPYSKISNDGSITTEYDSQKTAYTALFADLDAAIVSLTDNRTGAFNPRADLLFGGKVEKWIKFANTLKLRMAMRVAYVDAALAEQKAREAATHEVGTMSSNDDNAFLKVSVNPINTIMVDWGDTRVAADITSYMNGYADPRRAQYFAQSTFTSASITNGYHGFRVGNSKGVSKADVMQYSNINAPKVTAKGIMVMNAAEAEFLKAEGALRGWDMGGGTAQSHYEQGVQLSFGQWGVGGATEYLADNISTPQAYQDPRGVNNNDGTPSRITIAWDGAVTDFETNLERIITQKWIAIFPLGNEAWAEHRRTGYPVLMKSVQNLSGGIVLDNEGARRLPYPQKEYQQNGANMSSAVQMLGGPDNMATHVWWDCKNKK